MPKPFTATGKKNLIGANLIALRKNIIYPSVDLLMNYSLLVMIWIKM